MKNLKVLREFRFVGLFGSLGFWSFGFFKSVFGVLWIGVYEAGMSDRVFGCFIKR